jgi:hypothetical protein
MPSSSATAAGSTVAFPSLKDKDRLASHSSCAAAAAARKQPLLARSLSRKSSSSTLLSRQSSLDSVVSADNDESSSDADRRFSTSLKSTLSSSGSFTFSSLSISSQPLNKKRERSNSTASHRHASSVEQAPTEPRNSQSSKKRVRADSISIAAKQDFPRVRQRVGSFTDDAHQRSRVDSNASVRTLRPQGSSDTLRGDASRQSRIPRIRNDSVASHHSLDLAIARSEQSQSSPAAVTPRERPSVDSANASRLRGVLDLIKGKAAKASAVVDITVSTAGGPLPLRSETVHGIGPLVHGQNSEAFCPAEDFDCTEVS